MVALLPPTPVGYSLFYGFWAECVVHVNLICAKTIGTIFFKTSGTRTTVGKLNKLNECLIPIGFS